MTFNGRKSYARIPDIHTLPTLIEEQLAASEESEDGKPVGMVPAGR